MVGMVGRPSDSSHCAEHLPIALRVATDVQLHYGQKQVLDMAAVDDSVHGGRGDVHDWQAIEEEVQRGGRARGDS